MALSQPKTLFGIHQATLYQRLNGLPYGTLRVLGGSTLSLTGELVQLMGGSSRYPWDAQDGTVSAELALKPKEIPNFLIQVLLGKSPTETLNDAGSVDVLANVKGTSVLNATTGIDNVGVKSGSEADMKFGKYIVKAVSATTVDVYAMTNVDFRRGADVQYEDDTLKITSSPLTITGSGGVTELPNFGVEFTGGSGVVAMTVDDTAEFEIYPPSLEKVVADIGGLADCIPEFGAIITAQKKGDGSMWLFDCYRIKALGLPFGMEEKAYNEPEITATLLYDSDKDALFKMKYLKPATGCD